MQSWLRVLVIKMLTTTMKAFFTHRSELHSKKVLPVMENQQQRHQLEWVGRHRWRCRVCQWSWSTRRRSACPGVPRYAYGAWPAKASQFSGWMQCGRPGPPSPDGCACQLWEPHWLWLYYDEREATPVPPPSPMTFRARLRTFFFGEGETTMCHICGYEPDTDHAGTVVDGLCQTCHVQQAWRRQIREVRHWAQSMLRNERAVLLDTETTGLDERDVVIELALLSAMDGTPLLNTLIRSDRPIPWDATLRHGLYDSDMRSAPPFREVWGELLPILERYQTMISYSAAFHRSHLEWTAGLYGYQLPPLEWHCLMTLYARYYGKVYLDDSQCPYQWQTLYRACKQQHTDAGRSPRALSQVKRARRLLVALAEKEGEHWDASV